MLANEWWCWTNTWLNSDMVSDNRNLFFQKKKWKIGTFFQDRKIGTRERPQDAGLSMSGGIWWATVSSWPGPAALFLCSP